MKNLPPLNYLRSFEAAARHLSFTDAAEELNLTQAAVSQHIRALEKFISRPLFQRLPRSLVLTEVGKAYLPAIHDALIQVRDATESIASLPHAKRVIISTPVTFASTWLAPRIRAFREEHPDIDVIIHGTIWNDVGPDVTDFRILLGNGNWPGLKAHFIMEDHLMVVASPDLLAQYSPIETVEDLEKFSLIHILGRRNYWTSWAQAAGFETLDLEGGIKTDASVVATELAMSGVGLAIGPESFFLPHLHRGDLVQVWPTKLVSEEKIYLCQDEKHRGNRSTMLFEEWIRTKALEFEFPNYGPD